MTACGCQRPNPPDGDLLARLDDLDRTWSDLEAALATAAAGAAATIEGSDELAGKTLALGDAIAARHGVAPLGDGAETGLRLPKIKTAGARRIAKGAARKLRVAGLGGIALIGAGALVLTQGERERKAEIEALANVVQSSLADLPAAERAKVVSQALGLLGSGGGLPWWGWLALLGLGGALAWKALK